MRLLLPRYLEHSTGLPTHICVTNHHEVSIPPVHQPRFRNHRSYHFATLRLAGIVRVSTGRVHVLDPLPAKAAPASELVPLPAAFRAACRAAGWSTVCDRVSLAGHRGQ